jgi:AraC-like DNA-binding protein
VLERSRLAERTFKRPFTRATGLAPIACVQRLRVEDAKRRLERTDAPIDEISWRVGYEDPAFFRRLFKRTTGLTPGADRKRFRIPDFARSRRTERREYIRPRPSSRTGRRRPRRRPHSAAYPPFGCPGCSQLVS